jgi:5-methylcytosine-specific restriction endonuclease McrA
MAEWGRVTYRDTCAVCGRTKSQARFAGTKLEGHHAVAKRKLKEVALGRGLDAVAVMWDLRNRVFLCGQCHANHTNATRRMRKAELPAPVFEFASELALTWWLDRECP